MTTTLVISGNPRPGSRTLAVAEGHAHAISSDGHTVLELSSIADQILIGGEKLEKALGEVASADRLVVATPSYKGSLTGLLKAFLDRLPSQGLTGIVALPVVVAGSAAHVSSTTEHLTLVLTELGLEVEPGLGLTEAELAARTEVPA